jgi:Metal binding domain of Ada
VNVVDSSGNAVVLGSQLGSGGEAVIYAVTTSAVSNGLPLVAKIYHRATRDGTDKLKEMLVDPPEDPTKHVGHTSICWPQRLLYDSRSSCVGFVMPRLDLKSSIPLYRVYNPVDRLTFAATFDWGYLLRTAINVSAVVEAIHNHDYVVGDINESNLLVTNRALVTLVDCDSMQVPRDDGGVFRCPVGKPDFTPPELQGVDFSSVDRNKDHDDFALSVLIFLLLMEGVHPYSGVWTGAGDPPPVETRIRNGHSPYVGKGPVNPMPIAVKFDFLPPSVRDLCSQCFLVGHTQPWKRPSPRDWRETLTAVEKSLRTCKKNPHHRYGDHLRACPWCERTALMRGIDPFPAKNGKIGSTFIPAVGPQLSRQSIASLLFACRSELFSHTLTHVFIGLILTAVWRPTLIGVVETFGTPANASNALALVLFALICFSIACYRVTRRAAVTAARTLNLPQAVPRVVARAVPSPPKQRWQATRPAGAVLRQPTAAAGAPVVGSRIRFVYHSANCEWARKISFRNRVQFQSSSAARAAGYRQCQVCRP